MKLLATQRLAAISAGFAQTTAGSQKPNESFVVINGEQIAIKDCTLEVCDKIREDMNKIFLGLI